MERLQIILTHVETLLMQTMYCHEYFYNTNNRVYKALASSLGWGYAPDASDD